LCRPLKKLYLESNNQNLTGEKMKFVLTATPSEARFAPIQFRGQPSETFALAAEFAYDGVELHLRNPCDIDRSSVQELSTKYNLPVTTLGTGMAARMDGLTFSDPDPEIRRLAVELIKTYIDLAADFNAAVIIGSFSGRLGDDPNQRLLLRESALTCLKECCRTASDMGVTMLLEPLNRYEGDYLNTVGDVLVLIDELGVSNLKILADTFHMNIEEVNIAASFRQAGINLGHVHLVDSNRQAPGHGHLDIESILKVLRNINYQGYVSFETLPLPNPRQAIEDAISTIRTLLTDL
jgi:sugar phosphate isomerase/epimerase